MGSLKKKIKAHMPDFIIEQYKSIVLIPKYITASFKNMRIKYPEINFYSHEETIDLIVNRRKSLSRFGDGELMWMLEEPLESFQTGSKDLAEALRNAFNSSNQDLLIGLPYGIVDSSKCKWGTRLHWKIVKQSFFSKLKQLNVGDRVFADASITRPYIDFKDRNYSKHCFDNLRRIWEGRDLVMIEGSQTKLGMGNDLFSNAKEIRRIICPPKDAFGKINAIKDMIVENVSKDELLLVALGPTASILASQLCDRGYQIIDIGHVDVEYMWFLQHERLKKPIEGKFVNESGERSVSRLYDEDPIYLKSIIGWIK